MPHDVINETEEKEYQEMTKSELTEEAQEQGISGSSPMNKNELVNVLESPQGETEMEGYDIEVDTARYSELSTKEMDELIAIAAAMNIPDPETYEKEELIMTIEIADLAGDEIEDISGE